MGEDLPRALAALNRARDALTRYHAERKRVQAYQVALEMAERVALARLDVVLTRRERTVAD